MAKQSSNQRVRSFLQRFAHLRAMDDSEGLEACDIIDVIDGRTLTVGYARSQSEVDAFNRIFEEARAILASLPDETTPPRPHVVGQVENLHSFGYHDYLMSDGSIRTMTANEAHRRGAPNLV